MLEDEDRYYNWYHGYTYLQFPFYDKDGVNLWMTTFATRGAVSTQYFGDKFDADKVEAILWSRIIIGPPEGQGVTDNPNITFHFDIEKVSMEGLSTGYDNYFYNFIPQQFLQIPANKNRVGATFTPPNSIGGQVKNGRKVSLQELRKQKIDLMPGFKITWHYSGEEVEPFAKYSKYESNSAFIRYKPECEYNV